MTEHSFSRFGRSAYETDADLAAERAALAGMVQLHPPSSDATIIAVNSGTRVDADLLRRAPSARMVVTTTSGYDHLDLPLLAERGILAARLPLARRDAVVDSALGMLIDGLRRHGAMRALAAQGRWARHALPALAPRTIRGARIGVVGLGVIGARMAAVLSALGAEVWGLDPAGVPAGVQAASLEALLAGCDAITLHCRLTESSAMMLHAGNLPDARPGLVLVNTARGGLLDVHAAVAALDAGVLGALAVDVFPTEPWPDMAALAERPDVLFTPHAAGYHRALPERVRAGLAAAVRALLAGEAIPWRL